MGVIPATEQEQKKILFRVIDGKAADKNKYNLDGSVKRTHSNRITGESSEVFAFRTEEEIKAMIDVFDKHIANATDEGKEKIACRNKLLFLIGINIGIRASDLRILRWDFFFNEDMEFVEEKRMIKPKKTREKDKFVPVFVNASLKKIIQNYAKDNPIDNINTYIFSSRKNTGRKRNNDIDLTDSQGNMPISEASIWRILNNTAIEAGIKQNIGSHSLRKTFGYWVWHNAKDKADALCKLQMIFNHSSTQITARYIGITDNEISDMYNSIDLGLAFI